MDWLDACCRSPPAPCVSAAPESVLTRSAPFAARRPGTRHLKRGHGPAKQSRFGFLAVSTIFICSKNREKICMPSVKLRENEPFEVALRRFKRTCEKAGVLTETRRREFYEKPTTVRTRKAAAAVKRFFLLLFRVCVARVCLFCSF